MTTKTYVIIARTLIGKGKLDGIGGLNIIDKSPQEQKEYVLRDAELVAEIFKGKQYRISLC